MNFFSNFFDGYSYKLVFCWYFAVSLGKPILRFMGFPHFLFFFPQYFSPKKVGTAVWFLENEVSKD